MSAKTYVIVDQQTNQPVGLYTCDENPELAVPFGGTGQMLIDDPELVAQVKQSVLDRQNQMRAEMELQFDK